MSGKAPISHASTATGYGIGTTSKYGHCMTINNLTTSAHADGKALSAYQGYVLSNNIAKKMSMSRIKEVWNDINITVNSGDTTLLTYTLTKSGFFVLNYGYQINYKNSESFALFFTFHIGNTCYNLHSDHIQNIRLSGESPWFRNDYCSVFSGNSGSVLTLKMRASKPVTAVNTLFRLFLIA